MRNVFSSFCLGLLLAMPILGGAALAEDRPASKASQETPAQAAPVQATPAQQAPAKETPPPTPTQPAEPDNSILTFIKSNPDCSEITDECIICAVVNGKAMCSTPGTSCIRKDVRCTSTKPPAPKQ